jgi:hypothetical protein
MPNMFSPFRLRQMRLSALQQRQLLVGILVALFMDEPAEIQTLPFITVQSEAGKEDDKAFAKLAFCSGNQPPQSGKSLFQQCRCGDFGS